MKGTLQTWDGEGRHFRGRPQRRLRGPQASVLRLKRGAWSAGSEGVERWRKGRSGVLLSADKFNSLRISSLRPPPPPPPPQPPPPPPAFPLFILFRVSLSCFRRDGREGGGRRAASDLPLY